MEKRLSYHIGRTRVADDILRGMRAAEYTVQENDPLGVQSGLTVSAREWSPYVNRIRRMWQAMRAPVMYIFPAPKGLPKDAGCGL